MKGKEVKENYFRNYELMERFSDKDVFLMIKEAVYSLDPPYNLKESKVGRSGFNPKAIAVLIIYQRYINLTDRKYIRYLKSNDWILKELDLDTCPSKSTICEKRNEIDPEYFKKVNKIVCSLLESKVRIYASDSTGLKLSKKLSSWSYKKKEKDLKNSM